MMKLENLKRVVELEASLKLLRDDVHRLATLGNRMNIEIDGDAVPQSLREPILDMMIRCRQGQIDEKVRSLADLGVAA